MRGGGGRNGAAGTPTMCPDDVSRRVARSNAHPAPLGSTSRQPRSACDDAVDRHRLASPTGPTSRLRHGQHVAPEFRSPQGAWADGDRGKPTGQRARSGPPDVAVVGWSVAVVRADRFQNADPAPCRVHDAVAAPLRTSAQRSRPAGRAASAMLQRPRPMHTGVALPDRSHARGRRPALMLCLLHTSGIRCLAVLAERCTHHGLHHGRPCAPARGRGAGARADICWMPIAKGLTPHGLRHTHKPRMEGPRFLPRGP